MLGAELGAPADGATPYSAARPEWYFLFLFQFLKLFQGYGETGELVGAIVVPGAVMLLLFLMPLVGRWQLGPSLQRGCAGMLAGRHWVLTAQAVWDDRRAQWTNEPGPDSAQCPGKVGGVSLVPGRRGEGRIAVAARDRAGTRKFDIPPAGAITLLRQDAKMRGPELFEQNCAACHSHVAPDGHGIAAKDPTAPNLFGFASRAGSRDCLIPKKSPRPNTSATRRIKKGTWSLSSRAMSSRR